MKPPAHNVKLMVVQGGGPTAVLNASLSGVVEEARRDSRVTQILGARFGIQGLIRGEFADLGAISAAEMELIRNTPGAILGSTRYKPTTDELAAVVDRLKREQVRYLILIGGNGSQRGARAIHEAAKSLGYELYVIGVPKTIDNDIPETDRCPGFGSAARYAAQAVRDLGMDVRALPQPVSIYETMGRDVGWLAAATALAKMDESHAPHLICIPERPFEMDVFLAEIDRTVKKLGWCIAVVSEGLKTATGQPVYENPDVSQRDALNRALPGGVANYLAGVVTRELKIRCRSEKPGLCGRASMLHVSKQDMADAELVGREGVRAALAGKSGVMVSLRPIGAEPAVELIDLVRVAGERHIPSHWLSNSPLCVNDQFIRYARNVVGDLVNYARPL